jgi:DnaK suppressor protein
MTNADLLRYRERLLALARHLGGEVTNLEGEALQPSGSIASGDVDDPGARAAEEDAARALLQTEQHALTETRAALDRIERGTFGKCEACGHVIRKARLDAVPYARHCVACEKQAESRGHS